MLNFPVIIENIASLEASIEVPPRRPRNATRKRAAKKLRIFETTSPEVSNVTQGSRVSSISSLVLDKHTSIVAGYPALRSRRAG
jgi:hypothetical protein